MENRRGSDRPGDPRAAEAPQGAPRVAALARLARAALAAGDASAASELAELVASELVNALSADQAVVFRVGEGTLRMAASHGFGATGVVPPELAVEDAGFLAGARSGPGAIWRAGEPGAVAPALLFPRPPASGAAAASPPRRGASDFLLAAFAATPGRFDATDLELLCAAASLLAGAEEKLRAVEAGRLGERRLQQAQRLEAIGRLAGGVAHDFNNFLGVVLGNAELAAAELPVGHPVRECLREIVAAAERGSELARKLLTFGRQQPCEPTLVDPGAVVRDFEKILRKVAGKQIGLTVRAASETRSVLADAGQIEQALLCLVMNALDAMPQGGRLSVTVEDRRIEVQPDSTPDPVRPGPYVRIGVEDDGVGMSAETRQRALEPFFSTKPPGYGTGLGLAEAYGIAVQSGGFLSLESEPGQGTRAALFLPAAGERAAGSGEPPAREPAAQRVLLVEDEPAVRDLTARQLRRLGFEVLVARDASEALRLADEEPERALDLLLTDVVMPGLSGPQLARELSARRPRLRTLFISGYARDAAVLTEVLDSGARLLSKPFGQAELARALREALEPVSPVSPVR